MESKADATRYLFKAVRNGNLKHVQMLLNAGINLDIKDKNGNSIVMAALTQLEKTPHDTCGALFCILTCLMRKGAGRYLTSEELKGVIKALRTYPDKLKSCASCEEMLGKCRNRNSRNASIDIADLKSIARKHKEKQSYLCSGLFIRLEYEESAENKTENTRTRRQTYCLNPPILLHS